MEGMRGENTESGKEIENSAEREIKNSLNLAEEEKEERSIEKKEQVRKR